MGGLGSRHRRGHRRQPDDARRCAPRHGSSGVRCDGRKRPSDSGQLHGRTRAIEQLREEHVEHHRGFDAESRSIQGGCCRLRRRRTSSSARRLPPDAGDARRAAGARAGARTHRARQRSSSSATSSGDGNRTIARSSARRVWLKRPGRRPSSASCEPQFTVRPGSGHRSGFVRRGGRRRPGAAFDAQGTTETMLRLIARSVPEAYDGAGTGSVVRCRQRDGACRDRRHPRTGQDVVRLSPRCCRCNCSIRTPKSRS